MRYRFLQFLKAPQFLDDEEKTRQARALNALHLNMGSAMLILGTSGLLFFFHEKLISGSIMGIGLVVVIAGMFLSRRGHVRASGILILVVLWSLTILMTLFSGGMQSFDILFFVSGTVVAGILLGARGAFLYAGISLLSGLGLILLEKLGYEFAHAFTVPPLAVWTLLFINLVITVAPLDVALRSLSDSAWRAHASEER